MKKIEFFEIYMKNSVSDFMPTGIIYFDKSEALKHVDNENKNNNTGIVFTFEKLQNLLTILIMNLNKKMKKI